MQCWLLLPTARPTTRVLSRIRASPAGVLRAALRRWIKNVARVFGTRCEFSRRICDHHNTPTSGALEKRSCGAHGKGGETNQSQATPLAAGEEKKKATTKGSEHGPGITKTKPQARPDGAWSSGGSWERGNKMIRWRLPQRELLTVAVQDLPPRKKYPR